MKPRAVVYSFRVWITTVLAAPPIFFMVAFGYFIIVRQNAGRAYRVSEFDLPTWYDVSMFYVFGLLMSLHIFFLLWLGCWVIARRRWRVGIRKFWLLTWLLLVILATMVAEGRGFHLNLEAVVTLNVAYYLLLGCCVFLYRFPERQAEPVFDF
jgi:hypothetical protein